MSATPYHASRPLRCRESFRLWKILPLATAFVLPLIWPYMIALAEDAKEEIPSPKKLTLKTRDGVLLQATFYPGNKGKETVPVILLHGYKGSSSEYNQLAPYLQQTGCAVMVPDLRGHGASTQAEVGDRTKAINIAAFSNDQFVHACSVQELVIHTDWLHQPYVVNALDVHVELLGIPITGKDHLDLLQRDLFVASCLHEHNFR